MSAEERDAEALFERLVLGELAPDSPEVLSRSAVDPAFRRRCEDAQELAAALDRSGRDERDDLEGYFAQEMELEDAPGVDRVEPLVRDLAGVPGANGVRTPWLRWAAWLAAATVVALVALRYLGREQRGEELLGSDRIELLEPGEEARDFGVFRWSAPSGRWASYEVRVYALGQSTPIWTSPRVPDTECTAKETSAWPNRIRWEVVPYDSSGRAGRGASRQSSR